MPIWCNNSLENQCDILRLSFERVTKANAQLRCSMSLMRLVWPWLLSAGWVEVPLGSEGCWRGGDQDVHQWRGLGQHSLRASRPQATDWGELALTQWNVCASGSVCVISLGLFWTPQGNRGGKAGPIANRGRVTGGQRDDTKGNMFGVTCRVKATGLSYMLWCVSPERSLEKGY